MASLSTVLGFARTQAQTDSNGLTDAKGIIFANEALLDSRRRMIASGVDAGGVQEAYRDATVNVGTYLYPTTPQLFFLKAIELNYSDTSAQNYITAEQVDVSNLSGQNSFSWLRSNASPQSPQFDDRGDWYEVFPTFTSAHNLSQAIRLLYYTAPTEYTTTADNIAYPESLDYRILGWRIAANYYYSIQKFAEGDKLYEKYDEHLKQLISTLVRGTQQPTLATSLPLTGWEF